MYSHKYANARLVYDTKPVVQFSEDNFPHINPGQERKKQGGYTCHGDAYGR